MTIATIVLSSINPSSPSCKFTLLSYLHHDPVFQVSAASMEHLIVASPVPAPAPAPTQPEVLPLPRPLRKKPGARWLHDGSIV